MIEGYEFEAIFAFGKVEAFDFLAKIVEKFLDVEVCDLAFGV
jgi:hypothetical protein